MRSQASDKSELCNQLLFGESYQVVKKDNTGKWLYIRNAFDQYEGWIAEVQYKSISTEYFEQLNLQARVLANDLVGYVQKYSRKLPILKGSSLPFFQEGHIKIEQEIIPFDGNALSLTETQANHFLIDQALSYLGAPYLWGGRSPFGIDCSGFTQQVFKLSGYSLLRDAYQQATQGDLMTDFAQAQPGDLAFFERDNRIIHVGIIIDETSFQEIYPNQALTAQTYPIIHALDAVRIDLLNTQGIYNLERNIYTHKFKEIRRIF